MTSTAIAVGHCRDLPAAAGWTWGRAAKSISATDSSTLGSGEAPPIPFESSTAIALTNPTVVASKLASASTQARKPWRHKKEQICDSSDHSFAAAQDLHALAAESRPSQPCKTIASGDASASTIASP
ncbi:MAG TPA: hypothetical protein VK681_38615, partial [Reyranella sp.]|nr:hypothetical protein [Reyranella sp.]